MDGQCIYFVPPFFNKTCELLTDIPEPSLTSLDESMTGDLCHPPKENSFSDGEVLPKNTNTMATSTPQRRADARRSISLMDVSKIDEFAARPLGNILTSWETMGSQSSVGKSRDSGYVHSGSLMSVNSGKLSDVKMCPDHVSTILEECSRLRKELEYSEILINTLQETNNDLRNKCADAHNRISELRLKCANHCDCCSKQNGTGFSEGKFSNSMFLTNSVSSSSRSSRSSSPELINELPSENNQPEFKTPLQQDKFLSEDESSFSDITSICGGNMTKKGDNNIQNYNYLDYFEKGKPPKLYIEASELTRHFQNDNHIPLVIKKDNSEQHTEGFKPPKEQYCQGRQNSSFVIKDIVGKPQFVSVETKPGPEANQIPRDEGKPVFVADERKGKIWVGSFKVWGDSSIRVAPQSQSVSSVQDYRPYLHYSSKSFNILSDEHRDKNRPFQRGVEVKVCTPPSVQPARPVSVCTPFPIRTDQSRFRHNSLSNSLSNNDFKTSVKNVSQLNDKSCNVSSRLNSIKITVSSDIDHHKGNTIPNPHVYGSPNSNSHSFDQYKNSTLDQANGIGSFNNGTLKIDSSLRSSTPTSKPSKENSSNLGVSVSKSTSGGLCPDVILDKWNSLKKRLEILSFSSGSSRTLSNSSSFISVTDQSPSLLNNSKLLSRSAITNSNSNIVSPVLPIVTSSCGNENLSQVSTSSPQNIQECLDKAGEYAKELSSGLSCLPSRLDYIQSIGRP